MDASADYEANFTMLVVKATSHHSAHSVVHHSQDVSIIVPSFPGGSFEQLHNIGALHSAHSGSLGPGDEDGLVYLRLQAREVLVLEGFFFLEEVSQALSDIVKSWLPLPCMMFFGSP